MIIVDIWGGESSQDHLARHIIEKPEDAMRIGISELNAGNLVNLRRDMSFGRQHAFDKRTAGTA